MKQQNPLRGPFWFLPPTLLVGLLTFGVAACRPELPLTPSSPLAVSAPPEFVVRVEPDAPLTDAARVLRVHAEWPDPIDPLRVFLIRGEVSDYHLRQIARDDLTQTLLERIVPAVVWTVAEGHVVLAPTEVLSPGQTYALASGDPSRVVHFAVTSVDPPPLLSRTWPPEDKPGPLGIFCGDEPLPEVDLEQKLEPFGPVGILTRGIVPGGPGRRCLRLEVSGSAENESGPWVLPPVVEIPQLGEGMVQVEPISFWPVQGVANEIVPLECVEEEVSFGPGCAVVMDDRIIVRGPEADVLWGIAADGIDIVTKTVNKERFVILGLLPETDIGFDVVTIDSFGQTLRQSFITTTKSITAHVVINEVLANPIGPEPHQEWVELYNDGQVETSLSGYRILDIGGETVLPDVPLLAGQFAVVVNETFVPDDEVDVAPAAEAVLVRDPALGKSGLSNSGELLRLVDPEGRTISRFPALPKPKAGQSVSRRTPYAPDGVSSSFVIAGPSPGCENIMENRP